jgi:predicted nucleic acid-binding protein
VIDKIDLLDALFYRIAIPEAVWQEFENNIEKASIPQARRFQNNVIPVTHYEKINAEIGPGETEAIILYEQIHADRLLVEDKEARLIAEARGIRCTGTLGILMEAKDVSLISALRPLFSKLLLKGRYFSIPLLNQILALNKEAPL